MSFFHGVTVTNVDIGARTIALPSSSIIGLVDTFAPGASVSAQADVPVLITSLREAAAAFGVDSAIYKSCVAIYTQSAAVVVAVGVKLAETPEMQASAVIGTVTASGQRTGLQALLDGKSRFNTQPRLLVAPGHSSTQAVATAMDSLAEKLRAIAIVDGPNTTDEDAVDYAGEFGSKRIFMVDPGVQYWDTEFSETTDAPASAYTAGLFAWTDAEYGFWSSPSNKEFSGITGTGRPIEFLDGDATCRANLLNNANIATIIRDDGYRLWGNRTLSSDAKWAFVTRVRTLDLVMDAILAGHKWAVDRGITKTYVKDVTEGLNAFMRDLKNQGALIDFEVYADPDLNTSSQLAQGKVYWNIRFTDVPPAENPNFRVEVTDQWLTEVLDA
ncbi:putative phage tail sheath protein [Pseudomonas knackmussii B13]|uniref:Putative phage tail sheath protein n=1 Tax=Pseudomonas knackmussii (strain DSM 6978 / CCUG 54928 / LMG 23759 / B13) TaxID=1301098 RepID=A0A024HAN5_PSEKB|nr:phage tail sheath family protein [Pseudomonas knackmussii]CDF81951.1 putative phage tail sheath protein [Pseudomonas knackmussii B13]